MTIRNVQADPPTAESSATAGPFRPGLQVVFSCHDPDVMSARINYWGLEQSQLGQGRFEGAIRGTHSGRIQLGCSFRSPGLLIQGVIPKETVVLSSIVRQTSPIMINGYKVAADQMMWAKAGHELDFRTLGENELVTAAVHAPLFHRMAQAVLGPAFFDRNMSDRLALRGPQSRHDVALRLRSLIEQDLAGPGRLNDPEYASAWEHQVLDTWLSEVIAPDSGASLPLRCRAARQAESFLREHRDRPVSVCELCLVTGVPKRTLMLGFRDLFGLSPAAYHRRMRLNAARRDLVDARAGETTVTTTALRWGFGHFGRFSVDYRRMFGESPVVTLRG